MTERTRGSGEALAALDAWRRDRRKEQIAWKRRTGTLPCNDARVAGETWFEDDTGQRRKHGPRPHYLPLTYADHNLLPAVRATAIARFRSAGIKWHGYSEGADGVMWPSSHLLDSQVQCVNVLLALEHRGLLLEWSRRFVPAAERLIEVEQGSTVAFEWSGATTGADYLNELRGRPAMRGEFRTSADAFLVVEQGGGRVAILVEWKFTEYDAAAVAILDARRRSYGPKLAAVFGADAALAPFFENRATYQLMRLHLLANELVARSEFGETSAVVVQCVPRGNVWERALVPTAFRHLGTTIADAWPKVIARGPVQFRAVESDGILKSTPDLAKRYAADAQDVCPK